MPLLQVPHCAMVEREGVGRGRGRGGDCLQALIVQKGPPTRLYVIRNALAGPQPRPLSGNVFVSRSGLVACTIQQQDDKSAT